MATTYKYVANNKDSYNSLAAYAVTLPVTVTLFPQYNTIAISEDAANEVGKFIDGEALDFTIKVAQTEVDDTEDLLDDPTTDSSILREIAESFQADKTALSVQTKQFQADLDKVTETKNNYYRYWTDADKKYDRIKGQVEAIAVLVSSIFPKD